MPIGIIKAELRDRKDHFVTTVYKELREKFNINSNSILLLKINNNELIRIPTKNDFHISIPKKFISNDQKNTIIEILDIYDKDKAKLRENNYFDGDLLNFKSFIPKTTIFGDEIFILDDDSYLYAWYPIGGGAKHIRIKNKINAEKLAELIGFYFGDGATSKGIRSFRLNNCEESTLNYCLNILEQMGIRREKFKIQIIYSTDKDYIDNSIKERCRSYWSKILNIDRTKIVSVNKSKNVRETLEYGSARLFIDNSMLVEILLSGVMNKFFEIIQKPRDEKDMRIVIGFLRGLLAAEGYVGLEKGSLRRICIAFNPHRNDLELYKNILKNLDIDFAPIHNNELPIHKFKNFKIFYEIDAFKLNKKKNEKFLMGFNNHKYFKTKF